MAPSPCRLKTLNEWPNSLQTDWETLGSKEMPCLNAPAIAEILHASTRAIQF